MELTAYLRILNRRKWVILAAVFATFAIALVGRLLIPVKYESSAVLRVIPYSNANPSYTQLAYADRIMKTYVEIGASTIVMDKLRDEMGLTDKQPVSVIIEIVPDTELLHIRVTDYDASLASAVANGLADYLINDVSIRDVRISMVEPAEVTEPPSTLDVMLFYFLALVIGLLGGAGATFLVENLDSRLYDEEQTEKISALPVVGRVSQISDWRLKKLDKHAATRHDFQRLSANLLKISARTKDLHTLMVTSPEPQEGKSMVSVNLSICLAQIGYKVLLVDADFYKPVLHHYFGASREIGLSNVLLKPDTLEAVTRMTDFHDLWFLPNGLPEEGIEDVFLNNNRITALQQQMDGSYDFVIFDTSAFLSTAGGLLLSPLVDSVLVVARLGVSHRQSLSLTFKQLDAIQARTIGMVLNNTNRAYSTRYYSRNDRRERLLNSLLKTRPSPKPKDQPAPQPGIGQYHGTQKNG